MAVLEALLPVAHLLGMALAIGAATAKLTLLVKTRADPGFLPAYLAVARPVTRLIIIGTALLVLSGVGWLLLGYPWTTLLIVKLVLVGTIVVLGATLDNLIEPGFARLAPGPGQPVTPAFVRARSRYLLVETAATGLYYVIVVMWLLA